MPISHRLLLLATIVSSLSAAGTAAPELREPLAQLDAQFASCYAWWGQVYDADSGGCYYSLSGKAARAAGKTAFGPDIEATSKLVNVLEWSDLLDQTPQAFKDGIIAYMQRRQDPQSGFFRDPEFAQTYTAKTLDRAVGMAKGSIEKCGGSPLYPLPLERIGESEEADQHYAHLASTEALTVWLDQLPWKNRIWTCGSSLRAQSGTFLALEEPRRSQLLDLVEAYLAGKQAADGYYGKPDGDHWYSRLSGTYKAVAFLEINGRPVPMVETLVATVMQDLRTRRYSNLIVLYNTANILAILQRNGDAFPLAQRVEIVERCGAILATFKHSDGGFLTDLNQPRPEANGKHLGQPGVMESNTNSTGLAHKTRGLLHEIATGATGPYPHPAGTVLIDALREACAQP